MVRIVGDWFGMLGFVLPSFDTPDPLAEQYPHLSPYAHCAANPLMYTDPTGKVILYNHDMTAEQRELLDKLYQENSEFSSTFKYIYDELCNSETIYLVRFDDNLQNNGGYAIQTISYNEEQIRKNTEAFLEENVHAFQDDRGTLTDSKYNSEFEAKLIVTQAMTERSEKSKEEWYTKNLYLGTGTENDWLTIVYEIYESGGSLPKSTDILNINLFTKACVEFAKIYKDMGANANHHIISTMMSPVFKTIFKIP